MIFNSITFILFLIIVVSLYWILNQKSRYILLFLSSLIFYGFWKYEYILLLLISSLNDYFISIYIHKTSNQRVKKQLLILSLIVNLGLLFYFKYLLFFTESLTNIFNLFGLSIASPNFSIILPLGISFYTFQTISYTVDVYRGFIKPYKNFFLFGTYVTFFPQLIAGPILRASEIIPQIITRPKFDLSDFNQGIIRITIGLFLKVVIADNIAPMVDEIYNLPINILSALDVWVKAFMFGFQIYFDFSAYSHIAIGCALLMGLKFPENFNYPYMAKSFKSFWKRWHISLSSWIRDYLYLPLAGEQVINKSTGGIVVNSTKNIKKNKALFLTWAIMGLWHGASWAFVIWGIYHSVLIYLERQIQKTTFYSLIPKRISPVLGWLITLPLAMLGWLPFRENSLEKVLIMVKKIISFENFFKRSFNENVYIICFSLMLFIIVSYIVEIYILPHLRKYPLIFAVLLFLFLSITLTLDLTFLRPISQFIYFQF